MTIITNTSSFQPSSQYQLLTYTVSPYTSH